MLIAAVSFWAVLFAVRLILSSFHEGKRLLSNLEANGIRFSLFHVSYETTRFNNFFFSFFNTPEAEKRRWCLLWFDVGSVCMAVGQFASVVCLCVTLLSAIRNLFYESDTGSPQANLSLRFNNETMFDAHPTSRSIGTGYSPTIAPIIPGFNFPMRYVFEFWLVTFCAIFVHEFGHAAAASMERLQIQGCGSFFLFLFPGAYVKIEESVMYLPVNSQLRIYSAGVLHNIATACLSFIVLINLPIFLGFVGFWNVSDSLVVTDINPTSPLRGHISIGDHVTSINEIPLSSLSDFSTFLIDVHRNKDYLDIVSADPSSESLTLDIQIRRKYQAIWMSELNRSKPFAFEDKVIYGAGTCVSPQVYAGEEKPGRHRVKHVADQNSKNTHCCKMALLSNFDARNFENSEEGRSFRSCFLNINITNDISHQENALELRCLSAKAVLVPRPSMSDHGVYHPVRKKCRTDFDCQNQRDVGSDTTIRHRTKNKMEKCVHSLTKAPSQIFTISVLPRSGAGSAAARSIVFEGTVQDLAMIFELGEVDMFPSLKSFLHSGIYESLLGLPQRIALCFWLSIQLNLSIAFMNMLPVFFLDGGLACPQFLRKLFPSIRGWSFPAKVYQHFGSFLLAANCFVAIMQYMNELEKS